jgi:hypothetical protein
MKINHIVLLEGGNLSIKGREAQHLDLKVTNRSYMVPKLNELLHAINKAYYQMAKQPLWDPKVLQSGQFLSGSSLHFFNVSGIDDKTFISKKPTVGDIDTMVDKTKETTLQQFLTAYDDKPLGPSIFRGFQRGNEQFSALFELQDPPVSVQIDFEFVEFQKGTPTDWARFSHSSSWEDLQQGIKGVFHKWLIQSLSALSKQDFYQRKLVGRGKMRAEQDVLTNDNMYSFAVSSKEGGGLRAKYEPVLGPNAKPLMKDKLPVMSATAASGYSQDIGQIFSTLLGKRLPKKITQELSNNFWSFTGLINLLSKILTPEEKQTIVDTFIVKTIGPGAQGMYKNNPDKDIQEKSIALNYIMKALNVSKPKEFDQLLQTYRNAYKVVDESTLTEAPNYKRQGIQHIYNPGTTVEIKDLDFIELCKEIAENDGTLDNAPINLKVDGAGIRFGKDQNGNPFFMTSKVTEPKYIGNYGDFTKYAQSMGSSEDRIQFAGNYDKALKLIVTSNFMKALPPDTIVQAEMLFNDMAQQSKEGYKFVNINYDPKKLGKVMTLVPFLYKQYSTGEIRPDAAKIQQALLKASDNNIKLVSNNLQQSGINVSKIVNPIVANADSLTTLLKIRGDNPQKEKAKQIIAKAKKSLSDTIINSPIKGKDQLGNNIEGLVINMPSGRLLKVTSQTMKDAMLAKQQQVRVAPSGQRSGKTAVVTAGSFVGHKGHEQLINFVLNKAKQLGADPYVYISPSVGPDDPIPPQMKLATWQKLYPELANIFQVWQEGGTPVKKIEKELVTRTNPPPYDKIIVMVGEDRYEGFKNWMDHLSKRMKDPRYPGFEHVEFYVEETPRDPSQGGTGINFTKCREVLKDTNLSEKQQLSYWVKAFDVDKLGVDWIKKLMDTARKNMGIQPMTKQQQIKEFIQRVRPMLEEASVEQKIRILNLLKEYKETTIPSKVATCQNCKRPETKCSCSQRESVEEDWNKVNHHDKTNGMSREAVKAYRRENPGSKLKTAVTTKPSKLKPGSKAAKRRKSFCARMSGNKGPMKTPKGKPTPKALALRRWNCESVEEMQHLVMIAEQRIQEIKEAANPAQQAAIAIAKKKKKGVAEDAENFNGIDISLEIQKDDEYVDDEDYDNQVIYVTASSNGRELGHVLFSIDGEYLMPQDLEVEERFRGQGIAQTMYDYVKSKGYKIRRSGQQTDAGAGFWDKHKGQGQHVWEQGVAEGWSQKYKRSINCSHPKGFSQKAHCAGKKKHNESIEMEKVCEDCGMCQTHGNLNEIKKGQKDSNGYTKCWPGKHAEGTKKSSVTGKQVRNCVPNESIAEGASELKKKISKYEELALAANRAGDDEKCKLYQRKIQSLKQQMSQGVEEGNGILGFIMPDRVQSKKKKQDTTDPYATKLLANRKKQKSFWAEPEAKIGQKPKAPHREKIMPESSEDIISAKERLAYLEKIFDTSYEYSDDHSVWKKHNAIRQEMDQLKQIIGQDVTESEDNPFELQKKHPMNHGMKKFMIRQIVKHTEYGTSELSLASDEELTQLFNEVVPNAQELTQRFIGFLSEKIAEEKESRLYKQHQKIRKEKGLPDPSHYKKMAQEKQKEIDALNAEIARDKANLKEDYLEEN